MSGPVVYEVNLVIGPKIVDQYISGLKPHMDEMKAFHGFSTASLYKHEYFTSSESGGGGWVGYVASYNVDNMENLQLYFDQGAKRMRGNGFQQFTGKFRAWIRVLHLKISGKCHDEYNKATPLTKENRVFFLCPCQLRVYDRDLF